MAPRYAGLALLLVAPAALPAQEAGPQDSLRAYVAGNTGRHAYGAYVRGQKVGWMVEQTRLGRHEGRETAVHASEMLVRIQFLGQKNEMGQKSETHFALDGDGPLVFAEERTREDKTETVRTAVRTPSGVTLTTRVNGRTTERKLPPPRETLGQRRRLDLWLRSGPRAGATFETWNTAWEEKEVDQKEVYTYRGKKGLLWGGVQTDVFLVKVNMQGALFDAEILPDGTPIKGQIGGFLELRYEPEAAARKLDGKPLDMLAASAVYPDRDLGDPGKVRALTLEVGGLQDYQFPTSHRQRVRPEGDKLYLDLQRDFRVEKPEPLPAGQKAKYLAATPSVQSDQEAVRKKAREIVGDERDPVKAAAKIQKWVHRKVRKSMAANASTALEVLDSLAGDCTEHTLLFVSLARAAGLPAREVGGLAFLNVGKPLFGWHAWAEIHDGRQWVGIDPTWDETYVDGTHIKFAEGSEDLAWINVLGRLTLKVVKVEKD